MTKAQRYNLREAVNEARQIESNYYRLCDLFANRHPEWERRFRNVGELALADRDTARMDPHIPVWHGFEIVAQSKYTQTVL